MIRLLALCLISTVMSVHLKIQLHHDDVMMEYLQDSLLDATGFTKPAACYDLSKVKDTSSFWYPSTVKNERPAPWETNQATQTVWSSRTVTSDFLKMETSTVPGLKQNVGEVFRIFIANGCLVYPWGGAVRDEFLGKEPRDLDAELSCNLNHAYKVCIKHFGKDSCSGVKSTYEYTILFIRPPGSTYENQGAGTLSGMDYGSWRNTFYVPLTKLEYTANSIGYDVNGNAAMYDVSGRGVKDACNRLIRIPSADGSVASWDAWKSDRKIFRYWKLRYKGFSRSSKRLERWVVRNLKAALETNAKEFGFWYCKSVLSSSKKWNGSTMKCNIDETQLCDAYQYKLDKYNKYLKQDVGEAYWNSKLKPMIQGFLSEAKCARTTAAGVLMEKWLSALNSLVN